eukprot:scaffold9754_cov97-Skeletonema_dohrnii-CCMP3373.AAC.3
MKLLINSPFLIALLSASAAIYSPHAHAYVRGEGEGISDLRQQPWTLFTTATAKTTTKAILTSTKSAKYAVTTLASSSTSYSTKMYETTQKPKSVPKNHLRLVNYPSFVMGENENENATTADRRRRSRKKKRPSKVTSMPSSQPTIVSISNSKPSQNTSNTSSSSKPSEYSLPLQPSTSSKQSKSKCASKASRSESKATSQKSQPSD